MYRLLFSLILAVAISGCSSSSFVGRSYGDFTAYYNTYYNAKRSFEKAEEASQLRRGAVDRDVYLRIFQSPNASNKSDLDQAIKKSADILRKHDTSKWVDDALLLIGKSYFFSQNYSAAEQKFNEVIDLGTKLEPEAHFWLGRSLVASGNFEVAVTTNTIVLEEKDLGKKWTPLVELVLAEAHLNLRQWDEAERRLVTGVDRARDKRLAARGQYLLAQLMERRGAFDEATEAFRRVMKYNPDYELGYASAYKAIETQGLHGDSDEALRLLRRMERDDKHFTYLSELTLLKGKILYAAGQEREAAAVFREALYESDRVTALVRGGAQYGLGVYSRDATVDFMTAAAHFDTAAVQLKNLRPATGSAAEEAIIAPGAIADADELAATFGSYAEVYGKIVELDSLLHLGSLDDEAFEARIEEIRRQRAAEFEERRRLEEERRIKQRFEATASNDTERGIPGNEKEATVATTATSGDAGFLYHKDLNVVRDNLQNFFDRWGQRPLAPNWRYLSQVQSVDASGNPVEGDEATAEAGVPELQIEILPPVDVSNIPRDPEARSLMLSELAEVRYDLGNVLFLSMSMPDSAAHWYQKVIDEGGSETASRRAYYAMTEVRLAQGDTASANSIKQVIADLYPDSETDSTADSLALQVALVDSARATYNTLYSEWTTEGSSATLGDRFIERGNDFLTTEEGGKFLLAAARIHGESLKSDSLGLLDPIKTSLPDSLFLTMDLAEPDSNGSVIVFVEDIYSYVVTKYPGSVYSDYGRQAVRVFAEARQPQPDSVAVTPEPVKEEVDPAQERRGEVEGERGRRSVDQEEGSVARAAENELEGRVESEEDEASRADSRSDLQQEVPAEKKQEPPDEPLTVDDVKRRLQAQKDTVETTRQHEEGELDAGTDAPELAGQDRPEVAPQPEDIAVDSTAYMPEPVGGFEAIMSRRIMPEFEEGEELSGAVTVRFIVEKDGKVLEAEIEKSLGPGYDEEAIRLLKSQQFTVGRTEAGIPVRVRMALPIIF